MSYSKEIYRLITRHLDAKGYHYTFDADKELIRMSFSIESKLSSCDVLIDLRDDKYIVYAKNDMCADAGSRNEMAKLLTYINYGIIYGGFEMDFSDGEIRYRNPVNCDNCMPSDEIIRRSISTPVAMMEKYGDALLGVMMGFVDAKTACERAEAND